MTKKISFVFIYLANFLFYKSLIKLSFFKTKKKHILFFPRHWHIGGTKKFTDSFLEFLVKSNYNITIVITKDEYYELLKTNYYINERIKFHIIDNDFIHHQHYYPLSHSLFKYFKLDILKQSMLLLKLQIKYKCKTVIVSAANPTEMFTLFCLPAKILYFLHTLPWNTIDKGNKYILDKYLNKNKKIITVSNFAKQKIIEFWEIKENTNFVNYIYNFTESKKINHLIRIEEQIVITSIGYVTKDKNPLYFINCAIKIIDNYKDKKIIFQWIGCGNMINECKDACKNYSNIKFVGFDENISKYLNESDVYFHPSFGESHGISVIEAMSCGLPCIVTNYGGTIESIVDGLNGFHINPNNINDGIEKLKILIENRELRKKMGLESEKRYNEMFTEEIWESEMSKIFKI